MTWALRTDNRLAILRSSSFFLSYCTMKFKFADIILVLFACMLTLLLVQFVSICLILIFNNKLAWIIDLNIFLVYITNKGLFRPLPVKGRNPVWWWKISIRAQRDWPLRLRCVIARVHLHKLLESIRGAFYPSPRFPGDTKIHTLVSEI